MRKNNRVCFFGLRDKSRKFGRLQRQNAYGYNNIY
jgi:hypothetical protein